MNIPLNEKDSRIYREELAPYLPARIHDCHAHVWKRSDFPADFEISPKSYMNRFGGEFTPAMFREIMKALLPEQKFTFTGFGCPNHAADRSQVPAPLEDGDFSEVLLSPEDPAEIVQERIEKTGSIGVKPYLNYAAKFYNKPSAEVEIKDMLTPEQLAYLNRAKLAVTLHIPRPDRFSDPVNRSQMLELCEKYPDIKFIFAHIGRAYFMQGIREAKIEEFIQFPNAYFDTAMINHAGVLKYTFDHFPADRILFGSDSPIALLRGKSVEINNQYAYLMGENYAIGTSIIDTEHAVDFTTFYFEQLRAIIEATPADALEKVLYSNAQKLFNEVKSCQNK
jgi:predicted TIM-barrel fold metal-dependent hydrolase